MQCYSELLPPSGVTHSVRAAFTSPNASNLIVAKTSLLQVFDVYITNSSQDAQLVLVAEYSLQGVVTALDKVKPLNSKSGGEHLLLAFRDAKLSLIEWDPIQHSISTISIHYYENHDLSLCPWSPDLSTCPSHLTVDPSSRCAAFNFSINRLAIIPFHQATDDLALEDDTNGLENDPMDQSPTKQTNGHVSHATTPYGPSFVLPLTVLDPTLIHPIAMTFLHEYREPAVGVLFSTQAESMNMSPERRDILFYAVYTLDLDQKASTTLLSVSKLPNDLEQVFAVPGPIGGSLLIGGNELIHIDQGGRANAIGVNEFSKEFSSFPMSDQPDLQLRLEGCQVQILSDTGNDILLILNTGQFAVLSFRVDGRSVSGLSIRTVDPSRTSSIFRSRCSTISNLGQGFLFIGSEESDAVLVGTTRPTLQLKRQISRTYLDDANGDLDFSDDSIDDDEDDDIYGESKANGSGTQGGFDGNNLTLQDRLHCLALLQDVALGRPPKRKREGEDHTSPDSSNIDRLDLVLSSNRASDGCLAFMARSLRPNIVKRYKKSRAQAIWALSTEPSELESDARPFDDMLVTSRRSHRGNKSASLLTLGTKIREASGNDFEKGDVVIAAGRLASGSHVVVYSRDVRAYNKDFGLDQIFAIVDEDADATADVVAASVADTHILILKSDKTIVLLKPDASGDLDEIELPESVPAEDIVSANLYDDRQDFFDIQRFGQTTSHAKSLLLTVFTKNGTLSIHPVSNLSIQVFHYSALDFLPSHLSPDHPLPKHWRNKDTLSELAMCTLGSRNAAKPYLVLRHGTSDITVYEPYRDPEVKGVFRFIKVLCHNGDARDSLSDQNGHVGEDIPLTKLVPLHDVGGAGVVFMTGRYPAVVVKPNTALPRVHLLDTGSIQHVSSFHDSSCNRGFVYVDENNELVFGEIPSHLILDFAGWSIEKVDIGEEVTNLTYYSRTGSYVLATAKPAPFNLPRDDEWHPEWSEENEKATPNFLPTTYESSLKLISSSTHSVISQHHFEPDEHILSIKCLNLEVSEQTHERKDLIVVGTAITKGENVVTRGMLYLFDIVDVVPHPDIPETDLKLKLITKEDVRGAVTAISGIGSQGFLLAAQGQKCMVRGLREDNAILPVAFLDMRYYVSVAKELAGTGLTILADAFSGLWLIGYSEEPYKMQVLGRDFENPSIVAAEFLPQDKQLYIIASNGDGDLRMLQYDPENPKTERGSVLLQRSNFNTGYYPSLMTLLSRSPTPSEFVAVSNTADSDSDSEDDMQIEPPMLKPGHQILMTTKEGAIALITPLSEQSFRRLSTLQTVLTTQLDQPCGLNPRAHRQIETDGVGGRGMIDGQVVKRWMDQSTHHKYTLADRVGGTVWDVRADMEIINGAGLGYL